MTPADKNHPLQIRCPSCSQKFQVGSELTGRMVECGACESRFEVNDEVIQKGAKIYPGERNHKALEGFARVEGPKIGVAAATPIPRGPIQEGYFSPISRVSPLRIAMGWLGVVILLVLVFLLQVNSPGPLAKLPLVQQVAAAAVGWLAAVGLLVYANPRNRARTAVIAGLAATILLAIPFVFRSKQSTTGPVVDRSEIVPRKPAPAPPDTLEQMKARVGIGPLETEIRRLAESGSSLRAYGIWLRDMNDSNRLSVRDYILRTAGASPSSVIYPRDDRDYLMVITGLDKSLEQVAEITARIGRQQTIHSDLNLIETKVDSSVFLEGPLDKLTDRGNPAFYDLNKRELESIQLERVEKAVKRLADAEPKIYRDDITRQLVVLAAMDQVDFIDEVCKALLVWAKDPSTASVPLVNRLKRMHAAHKKIPRSLIALLAKAKAVEALPIVEQLWISDVTAWETVLGDFGPAAEKGILARFPELDPTLRHSAARLLAIVGGKDSIPVLEGARPKADPELVVLIDNAIKAIKERN